MKIPNWLPGKFCAFLPALFVLTFLPQIHAASDIWTGVANGDWSNAGNWLGGAAPGTTGGAAGINTDIATFNNNVNTAIALDTDRNIHSILFDTASVGSFTFNSTTPLYLSSGGTISIAAAATATTAQTFNAPIVIGNGGGSTYLFSVLKTAGANTRMNFAGDITSLGSTGSGTTTLALHSVNVANIGAANTSDWNYSTISGDISNSAAGALTGITKTGRGGWELTGTNTYSGQTVVNAGYLFANEGVGLSSASNLLIQSNTAESAVLQVSSDFTRSLGTGAGEVQILGSGGGAGIAVSFLGNVVVAFGGTASPEQITWGSADFNPNIFVLGGPTTSPTFSINADSTLDFRNPIDLGGSGTTRTIRVGNSSLPRRLVVTMSGELSGDANFEMIGRGTLIMPSVHSYTGTTFLRQGETRITSFNSVETNAGLGTVHSATGSLGAPTTAAAGTIHVASGGNGVTLRYQGGAETTDRSIVINSGQQFALLNDGTGALTFVNGIGRQAATNPTLILGGTSTFKSEIKGNIDLGTGALTKNGANTWILSGANTWAGTTTVSAGTLLINGDSSAATGNVTVASGARLGGTGTLGGNTTISAGGRLSPGASPGELTFSGNLTLTGTSFVDFEAGDLIDVNGDLSLSGTWSLVLGTGFSDSGSVTIFEYVSGSFASGSLDAARINSLGLGFTPTGALSFTDTGSSIVLNGVSPIPEPSTALLIGMGMCVILYSRRHKRCRA